MRRCLCSGPRPVSSGNSTPPAGVGFRGCSLPVETGSIRERRGGPGRIAPDRERFPRLDFLYDDFLYDSFQTRRKKGARMISTTLKRHLVVLPVLLVDRLEAAARQQASRALSPQIRREMQGLAAYLRAAAQIGRRRGVAELFAELEWFERLCSDVAESDDAFFIGRQLGAP